MFDINEFTISKWIVGFIFPLTVVKYSFQKKNCYKTVRVRKDYAKERNKDVVFFGTNQ